MFFKKIILLFIISMSLLHGHSKNKITIQLDWLHQYQFAGYYMAKEKGYFTRNNIDATIKEFDHKTNLVDNVLKNKNIYSVGKSSLIIDKMQGKDIVLLNATYQNSPMVLLSLKKSNINNISDFENKNIMLTSDARSAASITSMIKTNTSKVNKINFIPHTFKLEDLILGKTDLMGSYLSNEPYLLDKLNIQYNIFNPKDYGFDFYGGLFFTSQEELDNNPTRVKSVNDAVLQGWKYAFENIEETAELIYNKYNTQNKTLDALIYEGKILKELSQIDKNLLGNINPDKIEEIKRLYILLGFNLKENIDVDEFIYDIEHLNLSKLEKEYLKKTSIKFLTNDNFPPFTIKNKNFITGMEIDYWNLIKSKLGINSDTIINNSNDSNLEDIKKNVNYIKFSFDRFDKTDLTAHSNSLNEIKLVMATLTNKLFINDLSLLVGEKVAMSESSIVHKFISKKYPNINFIKTKDMKENIKLLKEKKVFAIIGKLPNLTHLINENGLNDIKISGILQTKFKMRLLVNANNPILLSILNKTINKITYKEKLRINSKYNLIKYEKEDYSWIYKFVLPLLVIIMIFAYFNIEMRKEIKKRKVMERRLERYANKDSLTKVYNRRKIELQLRIETKRAKRFNNDLSVIFFDIDNFKVINDKFGHEAGDYVLIELSQNIFKNLRETDYIGRWGGEEFIIILPETNNKKAFTVASHLKEKISKIDFSITKNVTLSYGITQYIKGDTIQDMIKRSDEAMYFVKKRGKDNIKIM